jgi:hypothetical protein
MNEVNYTIATERGGSQTLTFCYPSERPVAQSYGIFISLPENKSVATLIFPGNTIVIQLNKNLNWVQRICYNALGFKYKTL